MKIGDRVEIISVHCPFYKTRMWDDDLIGKIGTIEEIQPPQDIESGEDVWVRVDGRNKAVFPFYEKMLKIIPKGEKEMMNLESLCQTMLDPENQPPQFTTEEAWNKFKEITDHTSAKRMEEIKVARAKFE